MTRHHFRINKAYAATLERVACRPIENDPSLPLRLIRLEFSIYRILEGRKLESHGEIACRDLIVSPLLSSQSDAGLVAYANAIQVPDPIDEPISWLALARRVRWIEVTFGSPESEGDRNPFATIKPFDHRGWNITECRYDQSVPWVTIGAAANSVGVSESTVRRRVDAMESEWGLRLVRRTDGDHRRIYLPLFLNVWED